MATKTAPKKTTRKTTAKKTEPKSTNERIQDLVEAERTARSCAYPSCSAREEKSFPHPSNKDVTIPSCNVHAIVFETQAQDGAGIQQLMESYKEDR